MTIPHVGSQDRRNLPQPHHHPEWWSVCGHSSRQREPFWWRPPWLHYHCRHFDRRVDLPWTGSRAASRWRRMRQHQRKRNQWWRTRDWWARVPRCHADGGAARGYDVPGRRWRLLCSSPGPKSLPDFAEAWSRGRKRCWAWALTLWYKPARFYD